MYRTAMKSRPDSAISAGWLHHGGQDDDESAAFNVRPMPSMIISNYGTNQVAMGKSQLDVGNNGE